MRLVIAGQLVPLDEADPDAVKNGRLYIDGNGDIEAVATGNTPAPAGYDGVPVLDVGDAFVLPGFIDLHNHLGYNTLPPWTEPKQQVAFAHHDSWTRAPTYQKSVSWPANALVQAAPEAVLAYVQLRALVGGTTSAQGWPTANRPQVVVLRNVDAEKAGQSGNLIFTSALTLQHKALITKAQQIGMGAGFIYHCGEGQVGSLVQREFVDADSAGCLRKTFIGIHCNSITPADWKRWDKNQAGAVVWSPFSNLWLYGSTTDIAEARKRGVAVCLGPDWGPSGTKNVQGELKVAKLVSQKQGLGLSDRELVAMVTTNPDTVLSRCWNKTIGRLVPGAFGDVTVLASNGAGSVWKQIVESTERDVKLVVSLGIPRYGESALMTKKGLGPSSAITIGSLKRRFAIPNPEDVGSAWSWTKIKGRLDEVRKDPVKALKKADARRRAYAGPMDSAAAPLELVLDMPTGGGLAFAGDVSKHAKDIVIPKLPTLTHDAAFFASLKNRGFHGGLLDGLKQFYS